MAGVVSCPRAPSQCRTAGEHHRGRGGQPQQARAFPHCPCAPPSDAPTQEHPTGAVGLVSAPSPSAQHHPAVRTGSAGTQDSCRMPWGSPSWDYSGFSHLLFHPVSSPGHIRGSLALFTPPPSPPTLTSEPQGLGAPQQQPCAGCRDAPGTEVELTKLGLIPYRGLNPLRRPRGKQLAHPSSALALHSPSSTMEVSGIHQISPPAAVQDGEEETEGGAAVSSPQPQNPGTALKPRGANTRLRGMS